jgi:hypothetical protein
MIIQRLLEKDLLHLKHKHSHFWNFIKIQEEKYIE